LKTKLSSKYKSNKTKTVYINKSSDIDPKTNKKKNSNLNREYFLPKCKSSGLHWQRRGFDPWVWTYRPL